MRLFYSSIYPQRVLKQYAPPKPRKTSGVFYADKDRAIRWDYFIKRDIVNRVGEVAIFGEVIQSIQAFIMPVIEASKQSQPFDATWSKSDFTWSKIG